MYRDEIYIFVLYVLQFLPFALLHKIAYLIGSLAYLLVKPRRRIGEINLAKCFPEWDEEKRKTVLKQHFKHMAKLMLEYGLYWYAPAKCLKSLVRYRNKHYLDDALAAGKKSSSCTRTLPRSRWRCTRLIRMSR